MRNSIRFFDTPAELRKANTSKLGRVWSFKSPVSLYAGGGFGRNLADLTGIIAYAPIGQRQDLSRTLGLERTAVQFALGGFVGTIVTYKCTLAH